MNEDEFDRLIEWCGAEGFDLTLIEVMPMGDIGGENRLEQYLPLSLVRARLARRWTLQDIDYRSGGPARYVQTSRSEEKRESDGHDGAAEQNKQDGPRERCLRRRSERARRALVMRSSWCKISESSGASPPCGNGAISSDA